MNAIHRPLALLIALILMHATPAEAQPQKSWLAEFCNRAWSNILGKPKPGKWGKFEIRPHYGLSDLNEFGRTGFGLKTKVEFNAEGAAPARPPLVGHMISKHYTGFDLIDEHSVVHHIDTGLSNIHQVTALVPPIPRVPNRAYYDTIWDYSNAAELFKQKRYPNEDKRLFVLIDLTPWDGQSKLTPSNYLTGTLELEYDKTIDAPLLYLQTIFAITDAGGKVHRIKASLLNGISLGIHSIPSTPEIERTFGIAQPTVVTVLEKPAPIASPIVADHEKLLYQTLAQQKIENQIIKKLQYVPQSALVFGLRDLLTITTGVMLAPGGQKTLKAMTQQLSGDDGADHLADVSRLADLSKKRILKQYPELGTVSLPIGYTLRSMLDWIADQEVKFGKEFVVLKPVTPVISFEERQILNIKYMLEMKKKFGNG